MNDDNRDPEAFLVPNSQFSQPNMPPPNMPPPNMPPPNMPAVQSSRQNHTSSMPPPQGPKLNNTVNMPPPQGPNYSSPTYNAYNSRYNQEHVGVPLGLVNTYTPKSTLQAPHLTVSQNILPRFLSIPALVGAVITLLGLFAFTAGIAFEVESSLPLLLSVILSAAPLLVMVPVFLWLGRVEPEPRPELWHAFIWGAGLSVLIASVFNATVEVLSGGNEFIVGVFAAPFIEEIMKASLLVYIVTRRRLIDDWADGVIYALWVGAGFAVVEDYTYSALAYSEEGIEAIWELFIIRGLYSPFAHSFMTAATGFFLGYAISKRWSSKWLGLAVGLPVAMLIHALWNTAAFTHIEEVRILIAVFMVASFCAVIVLLVVSRNSMRKTYDKVIGPVVQRYNLPAAELWPFRDYSTVRQYRKSLNKKDQKHFDKVHAAMYRLVVAHTFNGNYIDPGPERVNKLFEELKRARMNQKVR